MDKGIWVSESWRKEVFFHGPSSVRVGAYGLMVQRVCVCVCVCVCFFIHFALWLTSLSPEGSMLSNTRSRSIIGCWKTAASVHSKTLFYHKT